MKIRTIEKIINLKFNEWLKTIKDEKVKELIQNGTILTGGSICSMLENRPVNDFDFYFKDFETTKAVAEYYVNLFKSKRNLRHKTGEEIRISVVTENTNRVKIGIKSVGVASDTSSNDYQYFELDPDPSDSDQYVSDLMYAFSKTKKERVYLPIFLSSNAITLSDDVQLVIRFFGSPVEIHENYDFVHCTNYWTSWNKEVVTNKEALECILTKELKYMGSKYPIASVLRIRKFIERGWHITAGQILKILMQIKEMNLDDYSVLEDQLIGVDVAYFSELLSKLKEKNPDSIDKAYLIKLIDEIF